MRKPCPRGVQFGGFNTPLLKGGVGGFEFGFSDVSPELPNYSFAAGKKGPIVSYFTDQVQIAIGQDNFLGLFGTLGHQAPQRIRDKGGPPKIQVPFLSHPIARGDEDIVGNGVTSLNNLPGLVLRPVYGLRTAFLKTDRRGIKEDLRPRLGHDPGALRIPLVPANLYTDNTPPRPKN